MSVRQYFLAVACCLCCAAIPDIPYQLEFDPPLLEELYVNELRHVEFNATGNATTGETDLRVVADDTHVCQVVENMSVTIAGGTTFFSGSFAVQGNGLGLTQLRFLFHSKLPEDGDVVEAAETYKVIVLRRRTVYDEVFRYGIIVLASLLYVCFGCTIELAVIGKILKKPIAPVIGSACQFLLMPLLGFAVAEMLSLADPYAFGLLAMSCSPGGGASNVWTVLVNGDIELSITMTSISTVFSLVMMPLWMFALGNFFIDNERISIPYFSIVRSLLVIVVPLFVGLLIRRFLPAKVSLALQRMAKKLSLLFVIFILTYGTFVNWYMYVIMFTDATIVPAAILVPWIGFAVAFAVSRLARLEASRCATLAIETGLQNASIPIIMLQGNFTQPEGDLAAVMPVAVAFFTPIPLYFASVYVFCRTRSNGDVLAGDVAADSMDEVKRNGELAVPTGKTEGRAEDFVYDIRL